MQHDITHCKGTDCPVKETCYRYKAYQEAVNTDLFYITVLIQDEKNKEQIKAEGKCEIYWPVKKYYGDDDSRPK